ncbi:hypothetical protein IGI04_035989, partial [Brassica rapa subsp. trilocularis]
VEETIGEAWKRARGNNNLSIVESLGAVRKSLGNWKRENNHNSNERMQKLRHELELESSSTSPCWERVNELKMEIGKAFKEEEEFWAQKSKDKWFVVGDNNTSFFHASVKAKAKAETGSRNQSQMNGKGWTVPESGRVKCNIGISWSKATCMADLGWIVRNSEGQTLLHSRRAFNGVSSLLEARRLGLIWSAESMISHRFQKVSFELEDHELVGSVNRPKAWPAFRGFNDN